MGEDEGWAEPSGLLRPNGLLANAGPVIRVLDSERWSKAEERTAELIACIQPNPPSEGRRTAVADYVQRLIMKCFPCQVFTFGSVPLKTYLPDGDIDLSAFSNNGDLKDTWANHVHDMLKGEEENENAEFRVKEVQYIQAEVKIIKCLVENIVVDISFNQLGGLCTLCFLMLVDHLISQNHLLKRSIILIKAWCYYESRILGAHHGLISTYALETLVLYIFHVFNNSFTGPLEVLYRFLEFFSNFDWDNFCVSLWGPVPIRSLPDVTAEHPRKDKGELLLSKLFLDACSSVYAVFPSGQENQGQHFVSKHFNVIDPLRVNNNLGRSVSKGNFFRIRSAFAFGAKRLARLLHCPKENLVYEVNQFFMNTWDRHGSGNRPDAPRTDLWYLTLSTPHQLHRPENLKNIPSAKTLNDNSSGCDVEVVESRLHNISSQHSNLSTENTSRSPNIFAVLPTENQKTYGNLNSSRVSDPVAQGVGSNLGVHQRNFRSHHLVNDIQGRFLFARTRSSPELSDTYSDVSSRGRHDRTPESGKTQPTSTRQDSSRWNNQRSELLINHSSQSSTDDPAPIREIPFNQSLESAVDSTSGFYRHRRELGGDEFTSVSGTHGMHQEEQDLVNFMASSSLNGQVHVPLNLASPHRPIQMSPSILASMEYAQRTLAGMVPQNVSSIDPSFSNMQFPQGFVSPPLTRYFPGLTQNFPDAIEPGNGNFGSMKMKTGEVHHDFWKDVGSTEGFESDSGHHDILQSDEKPESSVNFVPSSRLSGSGSSMRVKQRSTKENRGSMQEDHEYGFPYQDNRGKGVYFDDRTTSRRFSSAAHSSSLRSKTSSESSWDGSSAKVSKSTREKRGKKTVVAEISSTCGKYRNASENTNQVEEDESDWNSLSTMSGEMEERNSGPQPFGNLHGLRQHVSGYDLAQTSGSDSMIPIAPVLLGPGSRESSLDNSGGVPFAFYPTGPPVPFITMLPFYNVPPEMRTSDSSTSHFSGEDNLISSEEIDHSEQLSTTSSSMRAAFVGTGNEHKSDILNSDFTSHWQNLQFGRLCQNPCYQGPLNYHSPVVVPPMYLQGRVPWDGPGRPVSANTNALTQIMGYGHRLFPVAPLQHVPNRPPNVYQQHADEVPRYRSGTGTYLPNPVSVRDRNSSGARRGSYHNDRSDNHGDREGKWNNSSKSRAAGRHHSRSQTEKSSSRLQSHSQNGPSHSDSSHAPPNMAYSMYQLPVRNPSGISSNGQTLPSVVMLYPFDHNTSYSSHAEQLEFGSLGPVGFTCTNERQLSEGSQAKEQRFHRASVLRSSPDQPSSPHLQRSVAQRNYELKEEDFPPLAFPNQVEND
ncbi:uncharacterized protein LOC131334561 isoform X2 [Rhododendron vialii]|uniref:uncharacterized protein LOC131334561 isoform X2 n=1 Tax=Rhododendron vialii TaxID=182163 RepID=UPI00265FBEF7|nr:uncharacterized protein LOC131334561 isoform X2 [Rhododendron vialii]